MGGGEDSYGPGVLRSLLEGWRWLRDGEPCEVRMTLRTYSFDPLEAQRQLQAWNAEVHPDLIIGESLGCGHAMMLGGAPHLFLSPGINAFRTLYLLSFPARMKWFRNWVKDLLIHEKGGRRQQVSFEPEVLARYKGLRNLAIETFRRKRLFGKDSVRWFSLDREAGHRNGHTLSERQEKSLLLEAVKAVLRLDSVTGDEVTK